MGDAQSLDSDIHGLITWLDVVCWICASWLSVFSSSRGYNPFHSRRLGRNGNLDRKSCIDFVDRGLPSGLHCWMQAPGFVSFHFCRSFVFSVRLIHCLMSSKHIDNLVVQPLWIPGTNFAVSFRNDFHLKVAAAVMLITKTCILDYNFV